MLGTTSAKLTGVPGGSGWSQVHEFKPDDSEKVASRGSLYAVISSKRVGDSNLETLATGRELIARLQEEYYGDLSLKSFTALKSAIDKVAKEFRETWGDIEFAACSLVNEVVNAVCVGGGEVTISRGGILGKILKSSGTEVIEASGFPKKGDIMLLATESFHKKVPQGIIKAGLETGSPESAIEAFGPMVLDDDNIAAAIVIRFDDKEEASNVIEENPGKLFQNIAFQNQSIGLMKHKIKMFFGKVLSKLPKKNIYVRESVNEEVTSQSKRTTFTVALVLLAILGVSVVFGLRQKRLNDSRSKYKSLLTSAKSDVEEAIGLFGVAPEKSRELFIESEEKLSQIEVMGVKDSEVSDLRKKVDEARGQVLGEYTEGEQLFLDLSLLSSGFKGDLVAASGGEIYILDKNGKKIINVALDTKKSKVVAGPNVLSEAYDVAAYEGRVFVLAGDGIYEIGNGKSKVIEKDWGGEVFIHAFAGNMYILDKLGSLINRYPGQGKVFSDKQNWLAVSANPDLTNAIKWIIDGSVYVLFPNSKILKFSLGSPQNFSIKGVHPEVGSIDSLYTSDQSEFIYLLDKAGKRVVVVDKKGEYKSQYINQKISETSSIIADEVQRKIIILAGDKLYSIEIKHM